MNPGMNLLGLLGLVLACGSGAAPLPSKPNVVVILADDLGYGDVQCYNPQRGKIPTLNIDRLAAQGMRFTDAHSSSAVCSPSRYTLLTGRYHWRSRLQAGIVGVFGEPLIASDRLTIAGLAKQQGYATAAIGKWHLGWDWPIPPEQRRFFQIPKGQHDEAPLAGEARRNAWNQVFVQSIPGGPVTRGFDEYFGTDVPNWPPYCFIENDRTMGVPSELLPSRLLGGNPHLATMPGPAVSDWKLEAILPALADRACATIERFSRSNQPFLLYLPLTSPHEPIAISPEWKGKSGLHFYADFVMQTDAVVGRVLDALEKSGVAQNTLVLFTSDNGKAPYTGAAELQELGHFSSGPLRGFKTDAWEGGHREPFIVRWPGVVQPGSVCDHLVHHADLLRTLSSIFGVPLPDNAGEDSFNLLPLLRGEDKPVRQHAISCSASGVPALRDGSWKLIAAASGGGRRAKEPAVAPATPVLLYNLSGDLGETRNLADACPERVTTMRALLEQLIVNGRSTPGAPQKNDVKVQRFPKPEHPSQPNS